MDQGARGSGDIVVIGDSVMAWNRSSDASIPDAMGRTLGRDVVSRAVPGAQFDNTSGIAGAVGFDIQRQLPAGRWNWVVMNGGANDLNADCGCGACGPVVDRLIGADANSGSIPAFIRTVRATTGANVLWMGYYAGSGAGSFKGCRDDLVAMEARIARFAASNAYVSFLDAEDVIDRSNRSLFARDNTHPSPKGSSLIGTYLAQHIISRDR
ncbi:MAG: SGNH/GDSL hydrolase family protein [Sulfitobacter sp.]